MKTVYTWDFYSFHWELDTYYRDHNLVPDIQKGQASNFFC